MDLRLGLGPLHELGELMDIGQGRLVLREASLAGVYGLLVLNGLHEVLLQ